MLARIETSIKGNLEANARLMPGIVEHRFNQLQEIEAILEFLNVQLKKKRSEVFRKYTENYLFVHKSYMRPAFCTYEFNKWNKENPDKQIKKLQIIYMKEITQHPDSAYKKPTREMLCECK